MQKITLYSTPTCPYCKMAKQFLDEKNIAYDYIDVSENSAAAQDMVKKSGQLSVPVIAVETDGNEEIIVGFDREKISEILKI